MTRAASGRAAVVGAGIVGLSVAWFLQEAGFDVTVFDRAGVAAGASAGNAGWLCPGMTAPLPEPGVLRYALRSVIQPNSPLRIAPAALPGIATFLASFARCCTEPRWLLGVTKYAQISAMALESYDLLSQGGVSGDVTEAPVLMAFEHADQAAPLARELEILGSAGQRFPVTELTGDELRAQQPLLSARVGYGLRLDGQRYLQPLAYVQSLAGSVQRRGGQIRLGAAVGRIDPLPGGGVRVTRTGGAVAPAGGTFSANGVTSWPTSRTVSPAGPADSFDVGVLANGAWLSGLGKKAGIRVPVAAGRGYSFTVRTARPLEAPLYLPALRIACTPIPGGMRVAGTMEFRSADALVDRRRIDAIVRSARNQLDDVDWSTLDDCWVGPRPVTADGLPLVGATRQPGLFAAGGHGMWGMTLGPATGRLLAEFIATSKRPDGLKHFDPCR